MRKALLNNWSIMRGLRLLMGLMAVVQAYIQKDIMLGLLAGFLLITAIANTGCSGSRGCVMDYSNRKRLNKAGYEELDNKK